MSAASKNPKPRIKPSFSARVSADRAPVHSGARARSPQRGTDSVSPLAADRVTYLRVDAEYAGQRLDNFLMRLARDVPKSHIYQIVRSGQVRVNRARATVEQRVQAGDELRIPPLRVAARAQPHPAPADMPPVLFEDEHLLVVDKPAGVAAHGGSGIAFGLIERARAARPQQVFLELAHRLDRETSGVLLLAKSRRALTRLHAYMRDGEMDKRYLTLVAGTWHNARQHVRAALHKYVTPQGERRVSVDAQGQPAHTVFNRLERLQSEKIEFTLLEAQLHTGRTHQIRVHLAHLGFPIIGDDKYGDFSLNKFVASAVFNPPLRRMFLHAHSVELVHPISAEPLRIEAPLAPECAAFLHGLRQPRTVND